MSSNFTAAEIRRLAETVQERVTSNLILMPKERMAQMHHVLDRHGVIAQRRALAQVLPGVKIARGLEWWMH